MPFQSMVTKNNFTCNATQIREIQLTFMVRIKALNLFILSKITALELKMLQTAKSVATHMSTYIFFVIEFKLLPAVIGFPFRVVIFSLSVNKKLAAKENNAMNQYCLKSILSSKC